MPKPYSEDLRERVIEAVEAGASRREPAENFRLSASSAVRWLQRWRKTGSARAKSSGGSTSPLEKYANWSLALVAKRLDLTLDEVVAAMHKRGIPGSRTDGGYGAPAASSSTLRIASSSASISSIRSCSRSTLRA